MASKETLECMAELYQGEILGEIINEAFLAQYDDPTARRAILASLQAESETKVRLRPAMVRLGVPVEAAPGTRAQAEAILADFKAGSWADAMANGLALIRDVYVPRYKEIARIAAADGDPVAIEVANHMVLHESAFVDMFERLMAGHPDPTGPVDALLKYPIPAPVLAPA